MPNKEQNNVNTLSKSTLFAGIIASIAASACCLGPLVLLLLGISGSWISTLTALAPYRPIFIGLTLVFLGLVYYKLYLTQEKCCVNLPCAQPENLYKQRWIFWVTTSIITLMVSFPWYAPLFLD